MDLIEKNSKIAIGTTATSFALNFVLPKECRYIEKLSYRNFLLMTAIITALGFLYDKGEEMWVTSRSSPTLNSTLSESSYNLCSTK